MTSCPPRPACGQPLSRLAALCALGALATASLTACGGDSPAPITGVFLDAPVQGLEYVAGPPQPAPPTLRANSAACLARPSPSASAAWRWALRPVAPWSRR